MQRFSHQLRVAPLVALMTVSCGGADEGPNDSGGIPGDGGAQSGGAGSGGSEGSTGGGSVGGSEGSTGGSPAGGSDGSVGGSGGSTGGMGGEGSGGLSGSGGDASGGAPGCPAEVPTQGDSCTPPWMPSDAAFPEFPTIHCSWGDDPRPGCRTAALCEDSAWTVFEPDASACGDLLPTECGSTPPAAQSECPSLESACYFDDGTTCHCSECRGGSAYPICQTVDPLEWSCRLPAQGCPLVLPHAGSPCTEEGLNCGTSCDAPLRCQDGVWQSLNCQSCCPICAAPDTPIATPSGERAISSLREGELVYSVDRGAVRAVPLLRVAHTPVQDHQVMRLTLASGRILQISPGHPTADGRSFGELRAGMWLDESHSITKAELVPFGFEATHDILPASSTGTYFAAGALVGSTLFPTSTTFSSGD